MTGSVARQAVELRCPVRRITPADGHYFFGYYDVLAWDSAEERHLCHAVRFMDRLPEPEDTAQLGYVHPDEAVFMPLAETTAWNFQQGSMLQWNPAAPEREVIFNRLVGDAPVAAVLDVETGSERRLDMPVACVSPAGDLAASINFGRVYDFRPGYGYAGARDIYSASPRPAEDGVFLIDLRSGAGSLIMSLEEIGLFLGRRTAGERLLINHITFNTDGSRLVMLVRNNPYAGSSGWSTVALTMDVTSGELFLLHPWGMVSHYHWRDPEHILCWCDLARGMPGLYVLTDRSRDAEAVDTGFFRQDGHCSYSPDRRHLLYDSYPSEDRYRRLFIYDLGTGQGSTLGRFYSPVEANTDVRTDLHSRWSPSGRFITFDSTHEGFRGTYLIDTHDLV